MLRNKTIEMIALVDCNNFFVSCEKVFRPDIEGKPIIVLSNNDGCIVAMSQEVKALGIKRAEPYFKVKDELEKIHAHIFSSNYTLYQSLSNRVMNLLHEHAPEAEVYSIDEAFIRLDGIKDYFKFCKSLKAKVDQGVGIPVSIGIGRTKTLAKCAMEYAKMHFMHINYIAREEEDKMLAEMPIAEVWGIGRKTADMLRVHKIKTAREFRNADEMLIKNKYSLSAWKIQQELLGIEIFDMNDAPNSRKGISSSCSFSRPVMSIEELYRSLASYTNNALFKLQKQHSVARNFSFYIKSPVKSERFGVQYKHFSRSYTFSLPNSHIPNYLLLIKEGLEGIFQQGMKYTKAGVMLSGLEEEGKQIDLFAPYDEKKEALHTLQFQLQQKYGREFFGVLPAVIKRNWDMKREYLSPSYMTEWKDLPTVYAK